MIKTVVRVVIFLLIAHALYQFVPPYFNYHLFKDDVKQTVLFGGGAADVELVEQVMLHARNRQIPLERAGVSVWRQNNQTFIGASYDQPVKVLPWYTYPWRVEVESSAMHLHAPAPRRR